MRYAAEYVLPGHPDKLCDAIADALVQEAGRLERRALCGVEVAVHRASAFVTGRIACKGAESIDVEGIVRSIYSSAGYSREWKPAPADLKVSLDLCLGPLNEGEDAFRRVADDQSILTGYAIDLPGTNFLPPEHWLVWRLALRLEKLKEERPDLGLGPDGKLIVVYEEKEDGSNITGFSASLQQTVRGPAIELHRAVRELLREEISHAAERIPGFNPVLPEQICVNGAGNFEVGGPEGDNGLSGKKLVVDAYGPRVPIGGGALSGKDFFKVDRAGALIARRIAKAVVQTGAAKECVAKLGVFPGDEAFSIVSLTDGNGRSIDPARWSRMFNLALGAAGERYTCGFDLVEIARHGHFTNPDLPWEQVCFDKI